MPDNQKDLILKKPVSAWNNKLSIEPLVFFLNLAKAAISGAMLDPGGVVDNLFDALQGIDSKDKPEQAAWVLVYKSLMQSLSELVKDYERFFKTDLSEEELKDLSNRLISELNNIEVGFDARFFEKPQDFPFLDDFKSALVFWLKELARPIGSHQ